MVITKVVYCQPIYIYNSQCEGPKTPKIVHANEGIIMVHSDTKNETGDCRKDITKGQAVM